MCWHDSFAESPTRCNKNSIHSTSMPKVINSGGCSSLVYSKVCDFLVLLSDGSRPHEQHSTIVLHSTAFSLLHEIFTDSHRACFKLPDSNFQRLDVVLNVAFQREGIFLFISCLWRFGVCQLPCWCSHQPPYLLRPGVFAACLTWLNRSFFAGLVHTNLAGKEKCLDVSLHRSGHHGHRCFVLMGVFFRQIFTIHSLRCSSFARNRWKDSSLRTALAFLHPPLPSTPQRRRLTSCTSSLGKTPHLHNFFHVCAFWHVTRGTWGHRVTKKRRTPKEICWSSSRTSNNNPVSSFFFRSRQESTPAATVVKHFVTSHCLFCIRAIHVNLVQALASRSGFLANLRCRGCFDSKYGDKATLFLAFGR